MRGSNAFIGIVLLIATSLLILFGITALSPLTPKKATNAADERLLTPLVQPTVQFGNPQRGAANPKVTIVEFGDFQCEPCGLLEQVLVQVLADYPNDVGIVWKDLPNATLHPDAMNAATAARCAGEQGAFWEYHGLLLANQQSINDSAYVPFATNVGLDLDAFQDCYASKHTLPIIERDIEEALRLRIDSTPYLFVNDRRISGAIEYEQLKGFIDAEIAAKR
jgi:protein-disulfide isomerase